MNPPPLLHVEDVVKSFGEVHAVAGVSFEVRRGEIFGFLGPNGAGKTTTLRMVMGITRPDRGAIRFGDGKAIDRRHVGYLPEERGLYEDAAALDILVYLGTLRGMTRADARTAGRRWLERLELADRAKDKVQTLSKGNQQKVQFAGAVLHRPALVVLDEPFAGLDPLNQEVFLSVIAELRDQGAAVLISAHHLDLVERACDRFLLIARGRGILGGTLDEMRQAVARGAAEILSLSLRPRDGASAAEASALLDPVAAGLERRVSPGAEGTIEVEIALPAARDLAPILTALGGRFAVERVHMRPLPLHEVYLRAVRAERKPGAAEAREVARA